MTNTIENLPGGIPPTMYGLEGGPEVSQFSHMIVHSQRDRRMYDYKLGDPHYVFTDGGDEGSGIRVESNRSFLEGYLMLYGTVHKSLRMDGLFAGMQHTRGPGYRQTYILTNVEDTTALAIPVEAVITNPKLMPDALKTVLRSYSRGEIVGSNYGMLKQGVGYWGLSILKTIADRSSPSQIPHITTE